MTIIAGYYARKIKEKGKAVPRKLKKKRYFATKRGFIHASCLGRGFLKGGSIGTGTKIKKKKRSLFGKKHIRRSQHLVLGRKFPFEPRGEGKLY